MIYVVHYNNTKWHTTSRDTHAWHETFDIPQTGST